MSFLRVLYRNKAYPPAPVPEDTSFAGRTILVTGSNTGLGYAAALKFAQLGAQLLILAVRDPSKGGSAKATIVKECPNTKVEVWQLEMLSYASIEALATRVDRELPKLDIAVMNAGIVTRTYGTSAYGWEKTLQINCLSTTLLSLMLLPKLRASNFHDNHSPLPVLEIVSSRLHYRAQLSDEQKTNEDVNLLKDFSKEENFSWKQYGMSKLLVQYAVRELKKLADTSNGSKPEVLVLGVCPGIVATGLGREYSSYAEIAGRWIFNLLVSRTPDQGANTLVSGTLVQEEGHGKFWQNDVFRP